MGHKQLLTGNIATLAITILAFLQLLSWSVAGYLIIASIMIASLRYYNPPKRQIGIPPNPTVSKPAKTVREGRSEKPGSPAEMQAVEQRLGPKQAKPRQASVKTVSPKETPPRQISVKTVLPRETPPREKRREAPTRIGEGDYLSFDVELENGEEVVGEVSASGDVNVYVLTGENLTNLDLGQEFWYDAGSEGVQNVTLHFTAPENGKWFFVVDNADTKDVSATVRISVDKTSHSIPLLRTESLGLPGEKLEGKL